MPFLNRLREARQSAATAFFEWLLNYKAGDSVHAFFEGDDDFSFYNGFLYHYKLAHATLHTYRCGNKQAVYDTHTKIKQRNFSTKIITLFFVDKDLADILGEIYPQAPNIFVTDYYAIENYLVTDTILRRILDELIHIKGNATLNFQDIQDIYHKFEQALNTFYQAIIIVMAWIVYMRRKGQKLNLNNLDLAKLYTIDNALSFQIINTATILETLQKHCSGTIEANLQTELESVKTELSELDNPKIYVRGKFELWFLIAFVQKLPNHLQTMLNTQNKEKITLNTQLHQSNAVKILGPRVPIPPSLKNFLQVNLQKTT